MVQPAVAPPPEKTQTSNALEMARALGELLSQTPEYRALLAALKSVNNNLDVQKLSAELRSHQTALQWGGDADGQHSNEIARIQLEMEDLPALKTYRQAEREVGALFRAVDEIVSHEAGLAFAANAQRSGCGCGG